MEKRIVDLRIKKIEWDKCPNCGKEITVPENMFGDRVDSITVDIVREAFSNLSFKLGDFASKNSKDFFNIYCEIHCPRCKENYTVYLPMPAHWFLKDDEAMIISEILQERIDENERNEME